MTTATRTWGNLVLETRIEYGAAARRNRGRYAGHKTHRLHSEYIVALVDTEATRPEIVNGRATTLGARFLLNGKPVLFSCSPCCGCTQGQHSGQPDDRLTSEKVNCEKCLGK